MSETTQQEGRMPTVNTGRAHLTVVMRPPGGATAANADVDSLADPRCSQIIRESVDSTYFHQLRLRVAKDPSLSAHIVVLYTDATGCQHRIGLSAEDELRWPDGFEQDLWRIENAIQIERHARRGVFISAASSRVQATHWEGCWRSHPNCAVARIDELESMLAPPTPAVPERGEEETEAAEIIRRARDEISRLCAGRGSTTRCGLAGRDWTMCVPVQEDDSDRTFAALADLAERLLHDRPRHQPVGLALTIAMDRKAPPSYGELAVAYLDMLRGVRDSARPEGEDARRHTKEHYDGAAVTEHLMALRKPAASTPTRSERDGE